MNRQDAITSAAGPFSDDLEMIRGQLRRFIETEVTAKADAWERDGMVPARRVAPDGRSGRARHAL